MQAVSKWLGQFDWGAFIGTALCLGFYLGVVGPVIINAPVLFSHTQEQQPQTEYGTEHPDIPPAQGGDEAIATYTLWLVVFTAILAVSTIGLWLVTAKTLSHAKDDARRQADDSKRQQLHMFESNNSARKAAQASARAANAAMLNAQASIAAEIAHIKVTTMKLSVFGGGMFSFNQPTSPPSPVEKFRTGHLELQFKNTGRTEGDITAISINYFVGPDLPAVPVYSDPENIVPGRTIDQNGGTFGWTDLKRPKPTAEDVTTVEQSVFGAYWAYGYFIFLDYMNQRQRVRFCFRLASATMLGGLGDFFYSYGPAAYFGQEPDQDKATSVPPHRLEL